MIFGNNPIRNHGAYTKSMGRCDRSQIEPQIGKFRSAKFQTWNSLQLGEESRYGLRSNDYENTEAHCFGDSGRQRRTGSQNNDKSRLEVPILVFS